MRAEEANVKTDQSQVDAPGGPSGTADPRPANEPSPSRSTVLRSTAGAFRRSLRPGIRWRCTCGTLGCSLLDRLGYDANPVALIIFAGWGSHLVPLWRITRCFDRQGNIVNFCFAGLVTLRIGAVVRGWFAG